MNLTPNQEGVFRTILTFFTLASIFIGIIIGLDSSESVFEPFFATLTVGVTIGLVVAGMVVWVMKGFSE